MKNIFFILSMMALMSFNTKQVTSDYATIQGKIANPIDSLNLRLYDNKTNKTIIVKVDKEGNFKETIKIEAPVTFTAVYKNAFSLYLVQDSDIQIELDTNHFSESLTFKGKGKDENNYLKYKSFENNKLFGDDYREYYNLNQGDFDNKTKTYLSNLNTYLDTNKDSLEASFLKSQKDNLKIFEEDNLLQYKEQQKINKTLAKGNPSPEFNGFINYAGGKSSLKDFRGSYVYIDVWATWCAPCVYEIPFLAKVEEKYHGKNIKFVSISIDNLKDEKKWRGMIARKKMEGIQLLADKDFETKFITDYFITGIPRFILIDPKGNIVSYDAPRPSEEDLITLFSSVGL